MPDSAGGARLYPAGQPGGAEHAGTQSKNLRRLPPLSSTRPAPVGGREGIRMRHSPKSALKVLPYAGLACMLLLT